MGALIVYLAYMGLQLFLVDHVSPLTFLFSSNFAPDEKHPGALVFIIGSVGITLFAIGVGGPLGVAVGIFLSLMAPQRLANAMKPAIEILVGIPSVVYGWLGLTLLVPLVRERKHVGLELRLERGARELEVEGDSREPVLRHRCAQLMNGPRPRRR